MIAGPDFRPIVPAIASKAYPALPLGTAFFANPQHPGQGVLFVNTQDRPDVTVLGLRAIASMLLQPGATLDVFAGPQTLAAWFNAAADLVERTSPPPDAEPAAPEPVGLGTPGETIRSSVAPVDVASAPRITSDAPNAAELAAVRARAADVREFLVSRFLLMGEQDAKQVLLLVSDWVMYRSTGAEGAPLTELLDILTYTGPA